MCVLVRVHEWVWVSGWVRVCVCVYLYLCAHVVAEGLCEVGACLGLGVEIGSIRAVAA